MARNPIEEAEALYRRRRWAQLIELLEPMSAVYRDTARYSVLLGTAYLYKEDTGGAYSCFRRAQSLDYKDVDAALGLAAVYVRRGDTEKAVQLYVEVLERKPNTRKALLGLDYLRKGTGRERGLSARQARILYPAPPARWGLVAVIAGTLALAGLAFWSGPTIFDMVRNTMPRRDGVAAIELSPEESAAPVGSGGGFTVILTEKEALAAFAKAKRLFSDYRDEAALVELNRLLGSNATRQVKAKAESLAQYVREPSFLDLPDRFSYADVASSSWLYEGVGVVWKGLAANVSNGASGTSFELLVGYHDKKRLEGIVPVKASFDTRLTPDRPIEILARVRNMQGSGFWLECIAIHEQ